MANYNHATIQGRPTKDIDLRYTNDNMAVARFTLASNRQPKKNGENESDFINCVAFGKLAEFIGKYFCKGKLVLVDGRIQTGSYEGKDGKKVYTTDVIVEHAFFCDSANTTPPEVNVTPQKPVNEGFVNIPDDVEADGLPFN